MNLSKEKLGEIIAKVESQLGFIDNALLSMQLARDQTKDLDTLLKSMLTEPGVVAKIQGDMERDDNGKDENSSQGMA